ncbi:MAG TPA: hypothetical protein VGJ90_00875 [Methylophilaceae bacterium]
MPTLDLNFAQPCRRFSPTLMWILAALLLAIAGALLYQQQLLKQQIEAKTNTSTAGPITKSVVPQSPALMHSIALAHETQRALNLAWLPTLKALEQVQQANPEIKLLSIQPSPSKSEIVITGQTAKFDDLVQYQNSLHKQGLGEAVLLSQHSDVLDTGAKSTIGFMLAVGWRP